MQPTFQTHCLAKGIQLLRDDISFIRRQLVTIPNRLHKDVLTQYAEIWLKTMHNTAIVYQKQNRGRYAANFYLMELTENGNRNMQVV